MKKIYPTAIYYSIIDLKNQNSTYAPALSIHFCNRLGTSCTALRRKSSGTESKTEYLYKIKVQTQQGGFSVCYSQMDHWFMTDLIYFMKYVKQQQCRQQKQHKNNVNANSERELLLSYI